MRVPVQSVSMAPPGWPRPVGKAAMQGVIGDIVSTIAPHTEADPAALLLQSLAAVGNVIGRQPHFFAGATRHAANLFTVLVGQTARARKGTSWDLVASILEPVDPSWCDCNIVSGLGSGEGLVELPPSSAARRLNKRASGSCVSKMSSRPPSKLWLGERIFSPPHFAVLGTGKTFKSRRGRHLCSSGLRTFH